ncbi:MAG: HDOD domain-containing protein [Deltaproteobacteria bacterium]|nr:HDOD domain-containing protein [Deltaproteobacteria bacterium]
MATPMPESTNLRLLARNPIFTSSKTVWGYELQTTAERVSGLPSSADKDSVGAAVITGDYVGLNTILARNKKIIIAYTRDQILNFLPRALPARSSVILIGAAHQTDATLLPALEELAAEGHHIALEWDHAATPTSPLLGLASLCIADAEQSTQDSLSAIIRSGTTGIVRNVASQSILDDAHALGFDLFQGRYFKTAEIIPGKKLSAHHNSRLRIMGLVEDREPDLDNLARTIQSDVSLSYRLLTYLNSPAFGFARKIDSIRQAMVLLGWNNLRNWLRAVLLADMAQDGQQTEVLHLALTRGKFLERVVLRYDYWDFSPDEMFLLGMFSLLDVILGQPMADALAFLPLTDAQKKALVGDAPCEYTPLVNLMRVVEDDDAQAMTRAFLELSLDPETTLTLAREAGAWASSVLDIEPLPGRA